MGVMNIVSFLVVGMIAGWIAGNLMKGRGFGIVGNRFERTTVRGVDRAREVELLVLEVVPDAAVEVHLVEQPVAPVGVPGAARELL